MSEIEIACKLLQDIEVVKGEEEGKVTKTFLRKVLETLDEVESKEEFIISVGYMAARKEEKSKNKDKKKEKRDIDEKEKIEKESDAKKFFGRLKEFVEKKEGTWERVREEMKRVMEYTIKIYTIKADLGEDLCTKR